MLTPLYKLPGSCILSAFAVFALFGSAAGIVQAAGYVDASSRLGETQPDALSRPVADDEEEKPPGLDRSVIMDVVQSHMASIKHCYERELRKDPDLTGNVTVGFTVGPKGSVTQAAVKETSLKNKEVEGCIVGDIKTWIFPEPRGGDPVVIAYPFKFKPPQG